MREFFSPDYETARARFREGAAKIGARIDSLEIDGLTPRGERLSIDIGWIGSTEPERVVLHSSGLHGVEGFAGSSVQLQFLANPTAPPAGAAVILVHVLNPYGMAWLRRVNENNVDLNRNFLAPGEPYRGAPDGYGPIAGFLNPAHMGAGDLFWLRAAWHLIRRGRRRVTRITVTGQYDDPSGLFFGGQRLEQGSRLYQDYLEARLASVRRLIAVDVHTGLGPFARDTILTGPKEADRFRELGDRLRVRSATDRTAYAVRGGIESMLLRTLPGADVDYLCQEMGTFGPVHMLRVLRGENYWSRTTDDDRVWAARGDLKIAFAPPNVRWETEVVRRGRDILDQALQQLRV